VCVCVCVRVNACQCVCVRVCECIYECIFKCFGLRDVHVCIRISAKRRLAFACCVLRVFPFACV